jgi:hypothetical protein
MDRFWNTTDSAALTPNSLDRVLAGRKQQATFKQISGPVHNDTHVQSCRVSPLLSHVRIYRPLTEPLNRKSLFIAATSRRHCHYPHNDVSKVT